MPALNHVWRREGVYYFRMAIPRELRRAGVAFEVEGKKMRHEIKFSLRVSDYRSAANKAPLHVAIWRETFDKRLAALAHAKESEALQKSATGCKPPPPTVAAPIVTDERIRAILIREFVRLQKDTVQSVEALRRRGPEERMDVLADLGMETRAYEEDRDGGPNLEDMLQRLLASYGLETLPVKSASFQSLLAGYRAALLEDLRRRSHWIADGTPEEFDPQFKGIHAGSTPPDAKQSMTLAELRKVFEGAQTSKRVVEKTHRANKVAFRALCEHFGDSMPVENIDRQNMTAFFNFLDTVPSHAEQRYKGKSLKQAADLEAKQATPRLMGHRTKANYHGRIVAIFEHAKELEVIEKNPASIRSLQDRFHVDKESERPPFTEEEMNAIFSAPLFSGCVNDNGGWYRAGPNLPRRGRFWVPLLALFNGLRCNEACQLETADVASVEEVPCIRVTDESAEEEEKGKGKSVKNKTSKTTIPIHPLLLKIGFLEFVESRRKAGDGSQLFPELPRTSTGRYADLFSKWFRRFLTKAIPGKKTRASFHSFRHSFRDAERRAKLNPEIALRLGRWSTGSNAGHAYGHGFPMALLREELAKVAFPGLDLAHLLPKSPRLRTVHFPPGHPRA